MADFDINEFERNLMDEMREEPPEVRRAVDENIWSLFHDPEEFEDLVELSITVKWSEEDESFMALEHNRDASAFAQTPENALRELATVIELYQDSNASDEESDK